ncbi:MAG: hypothetical protein AAFS02_16530 [Pseudomonadota bacterium]
MTLDPAYEPIVLAVVLALCVGVALVLLRRLVVRRPAIVALCICFVVAPVLVLLWRSVASGQLLMLLGMWVALLLVVLAAASFMRSLSLKRVP